MKQWFRYWYCAVCGLGPYSSYWDSCAVNHPKPKD